MKQILTAKDIERSITRMAHEIIERNQGVEKIVLIGIKTRGIPLANRLSKLLERFENHPVEILHLDISYWRDDDKSTPIKPDIDFDVTDKICIIVDDVLFSGRTIRAAMDAIIDFGRPKSIQLAVLIDRGHRELPIRADFVGKNLPTSINERVFVQFEETDGQDLVAID